jgi:hypothetical protein
MSHESFRQLVESKDWFINGGEATFVEGGVQVIMADIAERFGAVSPTVRERLARMRLFDLFDLRTLLFRGYSLRELGLED